MSSPEHHDSPGSKRLQAEALSLGYNLAAGMAVFAGLGYFIGRKLSHTQAGILVGIFLGLLYGGYEVWKVVRDLRAEEAAEQAGKNALK